MPDDVLLNKSDIIERCLKRIREMYGNDVEDFESDFMLQDAVILNLQRACQAAIDAAMHIVRVRGLGLPQESRDSFRILEESGVIRHDVSEKMQAMTGFRNIAVHDYQNLNLDIVESIIKNNLDDFMELIKDLLKSSDKNS